MNKKNKKNTNTEINELGIVLHLIGTQNDNPFRAPKTKNVCPECGAGPERGWPHMIGRVECLRNQLYDAKDLAAEAIGLARQFSRKHDEVVELFDRLKKSFDEMAGIAKKAHEQRDEVLDVLREIEWMDESGCVYCGRAPMRGHKKNCIVGKVLTQYEREPDPIIPHSKSEFRRLKSQGANVVPYSGSLKTPNLTGEIKTKQE